jgi:hypothetical protein
MGGAHLVRLACLVGVIVPSPGGRYTVYTDSAGNRSQVQVREVSDGGVAWSYRAWYPLNPVWASGDRAYAFVDDHGARRDRGAWLFELVIWRPMKRTTVVRRIEPFGRFEAVTSVVWAPDASRILLLGPYTQGAGDVEAYRLWCVHWQTGGAHQPTPSEVTRAEWVDARNIRYWEAGSPEAEAPPRARVVRCRWGHGVARLPVRDRAGD